MTAPGIVFSTRSRSVGDGARTERVRVAWCAECGRRASLLMLDGEEPECADANLRHMMRMAGCHHA